MRPMDCTHPVRGWFFLRLELLAQRCRQPLLYQISWLYSSQTKWTSIEFDLTDATLYFMTTDDNKKAIDIALVLIFCTDSALIGGNEVRMSNKISDDEKDIFHIF